MITANTLPGFRSDINARHSSLSFDDDDRVPLIRESTRLVPRFFGCAARERRLELETLSDGHIINLPNIRADEEVDGNAVFQSELGHLVAARSYRDAILRQVELTSDLRDPLGDFIRFERLVGGST